MQDLPPIPKVWEPSAELRWLQKPIVWKLQQRWVEIELQFIGPPGGGAGQMIKRPTGATEWRDVPLVPEGQP